MMTDDQIIYLGKVAKWLKTCPKGMKSYGEFYVGKVTIVFDGMTIGTFKDDGTSWMYTTEMEDNA